MGLPTPKEWAWVIGLWVLAHKKTNNQDRKLRSNSANTSYTPRRQLCHTAGAVIVFITEFAHIQRNRPLINNISIAKAPPLPKEGFGEEYKYFRANGSRLPPILFTEQVQINIHCAAPLTNY